METKTKYTNKELDFISKKEYINENVLLKYGEMAAQKASTPISISDTFMLMDLEIEMCDKIFEAWEVGKFNLDTNHLLNEVLFVNREKFIYKILIGKILRLIPGGVTILSIGVNSSLARRFTQALGYAISELCSKYIDLVSDEKQINPIDIFTKEALEDFMESYLIEYNKTVFN